MPAALAGKLPEGSLMLGCKVSSIAAIDGGVKVTYACSSGEIVDMRARRVVVAAPPGVISSMVAFSPELPMAQHQKRATTATWCGDWCKVVATFRTPFWRDVRASGVVATHGPISVWWEGGGGAGLGEEFCSLVGLGFGPEARAAFPPDRSAEEEWAVPADAEAGVKDFVVESLGAALGEVAVREQLTAVACKCWMADPLTYAAPTALGAHHRDYGHSLLRTPTPWGVHWAGTETEKENGHVEGAIAAGQRAASEVEIALAAAAAA